MLTKVSRVIICNESKSRCWVQPRPNVRRWPERTICRFARHPDGLDGGDDHRPGVCIFTDASVRQAHIGLGVVVSRERYDVSRTAASLFHYPVRDSASSAYARSVAFRVGDSTFAELLGILFGLKWYRASTIARPPPTLFARIRLFTDSSPALHHLCARKPSVKYGALVTAIHHEVEMLMREGAHECIDMIHVRGHSGISGNEAADALALRGRRRRMGVFEDPAILYTMMLVPGILARYDDVPVSGAPSFPGVAKGVPQQRHRHLELGVQVGAVEHIDAPKPDVRQRSLGIP